MRTEAIDARRALERFHRNVNLSRNVKTFQRVSVARNSAAHHERIAADCSLPNVKGGGRLL